VADHYDLLILNGPPHSSAGTLRIAQASDFVVFAQRPSLDDLEPSVLLAQELIQKGIPIDKLAVAFCRTGDSEAELAEAREYVTQAGLRTIAEAMPERVAYRRAFDQGRSATETTFASLNEKADAMAQSIINLINRAKDNGENRTSTQAQHEGHSSGHTGAKVAQPRPARAR
jgi:chromosome partitioning protein